MTQRFEVPFNRETIDLELCFLSGQVFRWTLDKDGVWRGVDGVHWYIIRAIPDGLDVETNQSQAAFERFLRLDQRQSEVDREIVRRGPELAPYIGNLKGLRLLRPSDPHEVLFCFLCSANNHLSRITQMIRKLADRGEVLHDTPGYVFRRFPSVETIASLSETELRDEGFGYRAKSIPEVARQILGKPKGWLDSLHSRTGASYEFAHAELCQLGSVGPKLADCICLLGLDHPYAAPLDTHLWQAATRLYFPDLQGKAITDHRYRMVGDFLRERFGDLTGIAHQYLFYDNLLNWRGRSVRLKTSGETR